MARLARNISANITAKAIVALSSIVFIPVYIHHLGIEVYGLLGLFLSIQVMLSLLDLGLSYTITREFSRTDPVVFQDRQHILRTFEVAYFAVAVCTGAVLTLVAPLIAWWANLGADVSHQAISAFRVFAVGLALYWPSTLYQGALMGIEQQVKASMIAAVASVTRYGGGALVLAVFSPRLESLLAWHAVVNGLQSLVTGAISWHLIGGGRGNSKFQSTHLHRQFRYTAGISGTLVMMTLLAQLDRVTLTRLVSLEQVGFYVLAATVAAGLGFLSSPVISAFFPRLVQQAGHSDDKEAKATYHLETQLVSVAVIPVAIVMAVFAPQVLFAWTDNRTIANEAAAPLRLLLAGSAMSALVSVSFSFQAAAGWTRISFLLHAGSVPVMLLALIIFVPLWGIVGAAGAWCGLYLSHLLLVPALMHRRFLVGEYWYWLMQDVVTPAVGAGAIVGLLYFFGPRPETNLGVFLSVAISWVAAALVAIATSSRVLPLALNFVNTRH